jgi:Na+-driven multidrug efflux pump
MLLLLVGAEQFMELFSDDSKVIAAGALYLRVEAFILFSFVVIFVHLAMLQGIEKPSFIFTISIFRQIIAPILLLSLVSYLALGMLWVWLSIALIVTFSALVTWRYSYQKLAEVSKNKEE